MNERREKLLVGGLLILTAKDDGHRPGGHRIRKLDTVDRVGNGVYHRI